MRCKRVCSCEADIDKTRKKVHSFFYDLLLLCWIKLRKKWKNNWSCEIALGWYLYKSWNK